MMNYPRDGVVPDIWTNEGRVIHDLINGDLYGVLLSSCKFSLHVVVEGVCQHWCRHLWEDVREGDVEDWL